MTNITEIEINGTTEKLQSIIVNREKEILEYPLQIKLNEKMFYDGKHFRLDNQ